MKTKRCELRHWRVEDAYELYELAKDPDVGPRAGWKPHENVQESRKIIEEVLHNDEDYAIIDRNSGHIIGCISLMMPGHSNVSLHDQEVELGYWLGKEFWGQGYIPEAVQCLVDHAFYKLHVKRIYCGYAKGNEQSHRVQEKLGFQPAYCTVFRNSMGQEKLHFITVLERSGWNR